MQNFNVKDPANQPLGKQDFLRGESPLPGIRKLVMWLKRIRTYQPRHRKTGSKRNFLMAGFRNKNKRQEEKKKSTNANDGNSSGAFGMHF